MKYKDNWEETKKRFITWWEGGRMDRPLLRVVAKRKSSIEPLEIVEPPKTPQDFHLDMDRRVKEMRNFCKTHIFMAESFPFLDVNIGAGSMAIYLGSQPGFTDDTIWFNECIHDWNGYAPFKFDENNYWWKHHLELVKKARELCREDFLITVPDICENVDIISAMRGPQNFCFDLIDEPETIQERVSQIDDLYFKYYEPMRDIVKLQDDSSSFTAFYIWGLWKGLCNLCNYDSLKNMKDGALLETIEKAHEEIWRRFVYGPGILLDFAGLKGEVSLPTPKECRDGKINALGWWTPIENGAFFNGLYLDGLCNGWKLTKDVRKKAEAKKMAEGLLLLASVGSTPGFIARGVADDGKSHYLAGSDDQTAPWFYGLYKYLKAGIPEEHEKTKIISLMDSVAKALMDNNWSVPCDGTGEYRGEFLQGDFRAASRLLFITRAMYELTGKKSWLEEYHRRLGEKPEGSEYTRIEICGAGMPLDIGKNYEMSYHMWIFGCAQAALKELADMEQDEEIRAYYQAGRRINGYVALPLVCRYRDFDAGALRRYDTDWRVMNDLWRPQKSVKEAVALAKQQIDLWEERAMPARIAENRYMREPLFAAWILSLSADTRLLNESGELLIKCLCHYDWSKLYTSLFFIAECTCYELLSI